MLVAPNDNVVPTSVTLSEATPDFTVLSSVFTAMALIVTLPSIISDVDTVKSTVYLLLLEVGSVLSVV